MQKEAFERTGLIPRSIIRTFDRFIQQLLPGSESVALQEYLVSRYQILVSIQSVLILVCTPLFVNCVIKSFLLMPLTEHFWNSEHKEIFLNAYQEKRAFAEMQDFSEKMFFESLLRDTQTDHRLDLMQLGLSTQLQTENSSTPVLNRSFYSNRTDPTTLSSQNCVLDPLTQARACGQYTHTPLQTECLLPKQFDEFAGMWSRTFSDNDNLATDVLSAWCSDRIVLGHSENQSAQEFELVRSSQVAQRRDCTQTLLPAPCAVKMLAHDPVELSFQANTAQSGSANAQLMALPYQESQNGCQADALEKQFGRVQSVNTQFFPLEEEYNLQKIFQLKSLQIASKYNEQSVRAITNVCADLITVCTLYLLSVLMKPQIIILKSFVIESIYSLSDTTKSFLLILGMDLLVGFHSPHGWEIAVESLLRHFGLPENESFILFFVALFPVFLDTVFKYWIFRYLNKISPSTVVTYHSMLE